MTKEADVFCLTDAQGNPLSPAVQATVLAKYSRSPDSARDILSKLTSEEADKFQEKWVVSYGHNCYDESTEVLTRNGFIPWSSLEDNTELATLNPITNHIEYLFPKKIIRESYQGPMIRVLSKNVDLCVTPNHKMLVWLKRNARERANQKYELIAASEILGKSVAYKKDALWSGPEPKTIKIGNKDIPSEAAFAFMGFFIGDGYYDPRYLSAVQFKLQRHRKIKYLKNIADQCGFSVTLHANDKYYVKGDGIGTWLQNCYDSNESKRIPSGTLDYGPRILKGLFEGLAQSDGHTEANGHVSYTTTSAVLKEQLFELALKIGMSAYCRTDEESKENHGKWNANELHIVSFNRTRNNPEVNKTLSRNQDWVEEYNGMIYCAEMPQNHILYVRRNGRSVWSGNSVAELASIPVCMEGISIVASKIIESWQRPGYSEKSTRYQIFSRDSFVTPPGGPETMKNFASRFYDAYDRMMQPMQRICAERMGKDPNDPKSLGDRLVKARAFDNLRYLLPAGTGTNVAVNAYVRDLRDMMIHLRGSSNSEFRSLGDKLHDAVYQVAPTLVKHTEPDTFELPIRSLGNLSNRFNTHSPNWYVDIHKPHLLPDAQIAHKSFESTIGDRHGMSWSSFCKYMEGRSAWQEVPKVFKTLPISFEMMMDYGAFRDLQRHRRCEQYVEPLTSNYGYLIPDDIQGTELESDYRETMEAIENYDDERVIHDTDLMQYMIPLGYLHRSMFQMDLRELYYIVELRTKPQGHISYRRVAYEMFLRGREYYGDLLQWCRAINPITIGLHT